MKIKLAEALLRRKELSDKVERLQQIKQADVIYQIQPQRIKVSDSLDEVSGRYPKLDLNQVTAEYDYYARALRLIDGQIQQANWTCEIETKPEAINDYISNK